MALCAFQTVRALTLQLKVKNVFTPLLVGYSQMVLHVKMTHAWMCLH
jgi:hypothetical protein